MSPRRKVQADWRIYHGRLVGSRHVASVKRHYNHHNFISGTDPPEKKTSRFMIIRWEGFTDDYIYMVDETNNRVPLTGSKLLQTINLFFSQCMMSTRWCRCFLAGVHKADVEDVKREAMEMLNKKYNHRYELHKLQIGFRFVMLKLY